MAGADRIPDQITVRAVHLGLAGDTPEVSITTFRHGTNGKDPCLWVSPRDAEHLAGLVEMLVGAAPDRHRELAAAIRKAAAGITGADGAQP